MSTHRHGNPGGPSSRELALDTGKQRWRGSQYPLAFRAVTSRLSSLTIRFNLRSRGPCNVAHAGLINSHMSSETERRPVGDIVERVRGLTRVCDSSRNKKCRRFTLRGRASTGGSITQPLWIVTSLSVASEALRLLLFGNRKQVFIGASDHWKWSRAACFVI